MNETQKDWFRRMSENVSHLRNQYHLSQLRLNMDECEFCDLPRNDD